MTQAYVYVRYWEIVLAGTAVACLDFLGNHLGEKCAQVNPAKAPVSVSAGVLSLAHGAFFRSANSLGGSLGHHQAFHRRVERWGCMKCRNILK